MPTPLLTNGPPKPEGYWLPERYVLNLNAMEVGYLQMLLLNRAAAEVRVNAQGPHGELISTTMRHRLIEKISAIVRGGLE
jgi:hypothetical protein